MRANSLNALVPGAGGRPAATQALRHGSRGSRTRPFHRGALKPMHWSPAALASPPRSLTAACRSAGLSHWDALGEGTAQTKRGEDYDAPVDAWSAALSAARGLLSCDRACLRADTASSLHGRTSRERRRPV